ncbi:hypothetical protein RSP673_011115 [Ralstonia solanacearum P673]|uniref:hypothetical protein n=1 Tax=Ralstonia solanacearum TaxID=305 RepID=UPI00044B046E|nr:hypothetical protein [Ralstonia solanacearum]EUJ15176.1 hypothetical protein RSP673_07075 [Ralstonia solanacearum P673]MCL9851203.1 hypothetical protein [Ralstonia solanacearum]MCL9855780.1 hypothetical protein [Ralstonia solanacearum]MCL9860296.1 hypothetical protein [Ralstonia solanacearum]MCL9865527.1 hypothetical protein [Ralstonia solanacearum]
MSERRYYPAIYAGDFVTAQAALGSLGVTGDEADFVASGVTDDITTPHVIECVLIDKAGDMSRSAVVLLKRPSGFIGMWFGLFAHLNGTPRGAIASLANELLAGEPSDPPTVDVFEWLPLQSEIH